MALELIPAALLALAPLQEAPDRVVVASKSFTESRVLGEMFALLLEEHTELEVEHRAGLGGTLVCFGALQNGEIDLYPEYTGTGWAVVLGHTERVSDPLRTFLEVQSRFRARWDVEWLSPLGVNNTYALAMTEERAAALGVRSISDLARAGAELRGAFSAEFLNREDGYVGLAEAYGLDLGEARGMEHGLVYHAIASGAADVIDVYSTDGTLLRYDLRLLEDDLGFFPPYDAAPLVRGELLREHPEVREVLERLAFRIGDRRMAALNHAVEEEGRGFREVAREFLVGEGLLDATSRAGMDRPDVRRGGFVALFRERWRATLGLLWEHVQLTLAAVLLASAIAIPLGILSTRSRALERASLGLAGVLQTVPSLALLAFMLAVPGLGLSVRSAIAALFLYALLPILRNTITGLGDVAPELLDAARGMGLTERQVLLRVQLPLATAAIMAGVRTATVISVGVATLAAFIGAGGLGEPILTGITLRDSGLILSGAIPAALLALASDHLLGRLERKLAPRGR
jgi:osmoprotectant transport system permease protein